MGIPKFITTGVADVDALTVQADKAGANYVATVTITGQSGPVIKTIPHRLGRKPVSWSVRRAEPAEGVDPGVVEAKDGKFNPSTAELEFPGNGVWQIVFE